MYFVLVFAVHAHISSCGYMPIYASISFRASLPISKFRYMWFAETNSPLFSSEFLCHFLSLFTLETGPFDWGMIYDTIDATGVTIARVVSVSMLCCVCDTVCPIHLYVAFYV